MAIAAKHASATIGYEELFVDILVTKSLVFSVVGLDILGLAWAHRLTDNGYATIGIPCHRSVDILSSERGSGILRLGDDIGDVRASDVILCVETGVGAASRFKELLPFLRRGQVIFSRLSEEPDSAIHRRLIEDAARWGLTVGEGLFLAYLPEDVVLGRSGVRSCGEVSGVTEACSRIGNAICARILSRLA